MLPKFTNYNNRTCIIFIFYKLYGSNFSKQYILLFYWDVEQKSKKVSFVTKFAFQSSFKHIKRFFNDVSQRYEWWNFFLVLITYITHEKSNTYTKGSIERKGKQTKSKEKLENHRAFEMCFVLLALINFLFLFINIHTKMLYIFMFFYYVCTKKLLSTRKFKQISITYTHFIYLLINSLQEMPFRLFL